MSLTDVQVQVAVVAAVAGVFGAVVGGMIGAVGAWIVARMNRDEARRTALLDDRKAAIVGFATATRIERHRRLDVLDWYRSPSDGDPPRFDPTRRELERASLEVAILAPDMMPWVVDYMELDTAQNVAVQSFTKAWRSAPVPERSALRVPRFSEEERRQQEAMDGFIHAASANLGVTLG